MKIIFTTHTYYPSKDGVAIVNDYLTKGLSRKGYSVVVVTHKKDNVPEEEDYCGIRVCRIYEGDNYKYLTFIKKIVDKEDVLVNVCTQTVTTDVLLSHLDEIKCSKKILYVHGIWNFKWDVRNKASIHNVLSKIYNNAKWRYYYLKNGKYIKKYDVVTQLHNMDEGNLFFKKYYNISSVIMENAADDAFFNKNDDSAFLKKYGLEDKYLLCVANYSSGKNQEMVLKAYYQSDATYELVFVGNDNSGYIDRLKETEIELQSRSGEQLEKKRKRVRFLQNINREEIPMFVRNANLFLFGSIGEKFPMSIVEPMAAGVPFISTDVGIVRYFPGGITVAINDEEAMADKINFLINDHQEWLKLSAEGAEYANARMRINDKINLFEATLK